MTIPVIFRRSLRSAVIKVLDCGLELNVFEL